MKESLLKVDIQLLLSSYCRKILIGTFVEVLWLSKRCDVENSYDLVHFRCGVLCKVRKHHIISLTIFPPLCCKTIFTNRKLSSSLMQ